MTKRSDPEPGPGPTSTLKPAPGDLQLLQAFLNSESLAPESDVANPRTFADWLEQQGLVTPGTRIDEDDLHRAVEVREAIRTVLARGPAKAIATAAERLDQVMAAATIRTRFDPGGRVRFEPVPGGLDAVLARLGAVVAQAQFEGTWELVKVCTARNCNAVFFDDSKNHSRKWCSTKCCNRSTSLAHRNRNLRKARENERLSAYRRRYLA